MDDLCISVNSICCDWLYCNLTYFDGYQGLQCGGGKFWLNLEPASNLKLSQYCAAVQVLIIEWKQFFSLS